jgi:RNA polymerase sigma-70 factor (ECF subfamily)
MAIPELVYERNGELHPARSGFGNVRGRAGKNQSMPADPVPPDDRKDYLRRLVESHFDAVFAFFARRVGTELARDLSAETFKEAIANISRFDPQRGSEIAWLFAIAHHVLSHHRRSERRRLRAYMAFAGEGVTRVDPGGRDDALDEATLARVARALRRLPSAQRDAFVLVAIEGVTYADAAFILGVPDGTVRSRVSRARARLRAAARLGAVGHPGEPAGVQGGN